MPARDRHRMRRFGSHVIVLPKLLHAYQPSSLDRATSLGVIGPGYDPSGWLRAPRIRYVFVQARSALLSPADGSITRSAEAASQQACPAGARSLKALSAMMRTTLKRNQQIPDLCPLRRTANGHRLPFER